MKSEKLERHVLSIAKKVLRVSKAQSYTASGLFIADAVLSGITGKFNKMFYHLSAGLGAVAISVILSKLKKACISKLSMVDQKAYFENNSSSQGILNVCKVDTKKQSMNEMRTILESKILEEKSKNNRNQAEISDCKAGLKEIKKASKFIKTTDRPEEAMLLYGTGIVTGAYLVIRHFGRV